MSVYIYEHKPWTDRWAGQEEGCAPSIHYRTNLSRKPLFEVGEHIELRGVVLEVKVVGEHGIVLETPIHTKSRTYRFGAGIEGMQLEPDPELDAMIAASANKPEIAPTDGAFRSQTTGLVLHNDSPSVGRFEQSQSDGMDNPASPTFQMATDEYASRFVQKLQSIGAQEEQLPTPVTTDSNDAGYNYISRPAQ